MPDFPPPPVLELEGEFTAWTHKWTHELAPLQDISIMIASDGKRVLLPYSEEAFPNDLRLRLVNLEDGSLVSDISNEWYTLVSAWYQPDMLDFQKVQCSSFARSIFGRYVVSCKKDINSLFVWRDGVEFYEIEMPAGINIETCIGMSYEGKYILLLDGVKLVCFEGS